MDLWRWMSIKCLLHKNKDLSLNPNALIKRKKKKKLHVVVRIYNPSFGSRRESQADPGAPCQSA